MKPKLRADLVLAEMAKTFAERNAVYGDNFRMVAPMMAILFPQGVPPEVVLKDQFHLFELMLVKISRFAISNLEHIDSVHDAAVYAAMIEAILREPVDLTELKYDNSPSTLPDNNALLNRKEIKS